MKIIDKLKSFFAIPQPYCKEYDVQRSTYNQNTVFYTSIALVPVLLIVNLIRFLNSRSSGIEKDSVTTALYYIGVLVCLLVAVTLWIIRYLKKKGRALPAWVTDIVCAAAFVAFFSLFLISYWRRVSLVAERRETIAASMDVFIILFFILVFLTRFSCIFTLTLQTSFAIVLNIFLSVIHKNIDNYLASIININIAFLFAAIGTCLLWANRQRMFVNEKNMESLLSSDFLTRLKNRRGFDVFLNETWKSAVEKEKSLTMFMIDIDNFKKYNDTFGHVEGDNCLYAVAKAIASSLRRDDFAARYGGEEFAVVMTGCSKQMALTIANRILDKLKEANLPHPENVVPYVTVSIGMSITLPAQKEITPLQFIRNADSALYAAKKTGKNKIVFFGEE